MVIIDSTVWVDALRRRGSLETKVSLEALLQVFEAELCAHVRLEVLSAARKRDRALLQQHFSTLPNREIASEDWDRAIAYSWELRDRGVDVPWNCILTASLARYDQSRIYTFDDYLREIASVDDQVRLYAPGYGGAYVPDMESA